MTAFASPLNGFTTTLASSRALGGSTVTLATGSGAAILAELTRQGLPAISASAPLRFTLATTAAVRRFSLANPTLGPIFTATGLAGEVLSGVTVAEGTTDAGYSTGDYFLCTFSAGQLVAVQAAINTAETNIALKAPLASPAFTGTPTGDMSATTTTPSGGQSRTLALQAARVDMAGSASQDLLTGLGVAVTTSNVQLSLTPTGAASTTSTFSGFGTPVGVATNFNRVEVAIVPFDVTKPISNVRMRLFTVDQNGTLLADKTVTLTTPSVFAGSIPVTFIPFDLDATIANAAGTQLWCEFYTDGRSGVYTAGVLPYPLPTFPVARFCVTSSVTTLTSSPFSGGTTTNMWCRFSLVDQSASRVGGAGGFKAGVITNAIQPVYTPTLTVGPILYAVVGHEANVYFPNVFKSQFPNGFGASPLEFDIAQAQGLGTHENDRWTYTPVVGDIADRTIVLSAAWNGTTVATTTPTLRIKAAKAVSTITRKVLVIGDSTSAPGNGDVWIAELLNLFNFNCTSPTPAGGADNMTITLLGTKTSTANDAGGTGRAVKSEAVTGQTVAYFATDPASPFVFSTVFNFQSYLTAQSYTMAANDWVLIHLGINDIFSAATDAAVLTTFGTARSQLDTMLTSIHAAGAGIRVGIMLTIAPSRNQDAFGANYGIGQTRYRYKRNIDIWREQLLAFYGTSTGTNTFVCPVHAYVDTANNMQTATAAFNSRNATTTTRQSNGVHPAANGYYQMADAVYAFLRGQES